MRRVSKAQLLSSSQTVNMPSQSIMSKFITPFVAERKIKFDVFRYDDEGKLSDVYVAIRTYGTDKEFICLTQREMSRLQDFLEKQLTGAIGYMKREVWVKKRGLNDFAIELRNNGNTQRITLSPTEMKLLADADIPQYLSFDVVD